MMEKINTEEPLRFSFNLEDLLQAGQVITANGKWYVVTVFEISEPQSVPIFFGPCGDCEEETEGYFFCDNCGREILEVKP